MALKILKFVLSGPDRIANKSVHLQNKTFTLTFIPLWIFVMTPFEFKVSINPWTTPKQDCSVLASTSVHLVAIMW